MSCFSLSNLEQNQSTKFFLLGLLLVTSQEILSDYFVSVNLPVQSTIVLSLLVEMRLELLM